MLNSSSRLRLRQQSFGCARSLERALFAEQAAWAHQQDKSHYDVNDRLACARDFPMLIDGVEICPGIYCLPLSPTGCR
jgi:hypothetical protein